MEKFRVVIIDDEKDICFFMQKMLERTGLYTVFTATEGIEGKDFCIREKPDLIFVDYILPGLKGDKIIAMLRLDSGTKKIPIVLMSGLGEMSYIERKQKWEWTPNKEIVETRGEIPDALKWKRSSEEIAQEFGVELYLHKPFTNEVLLEVAAKILNVKPEENKPQPF